MISFSARVAIELHQYESECVALCTGIDDYRAIERSIELQQHLGPSEMIHSDSEGHEHGIVYKA